MSVVPRKPKIPIDKYLLIGETSRDLHVDTLRECVNNKPHIIPFDYWDKDKDTMCKCKNCDFTFKKGHWHLLPQGFIEIEKTKNK